MWLIAVEGGMRVCLPPEKFGNVLASASTVITWVVVVL
jgi:hypothetical protein